MLTIVPVIYKPDSKPATIPFHHLVRRNSGKRTATSIRPAVPVGVYVWPIQAWTSASMWLIPPNQSVQTSMIQQDK